MAKNNRSASYKLEPTFMNYQHYFTHIGVKEMDSNFKKIPPNQEENRFFSIYLSGCNCNKRDEYSGSFSSENVMYKILILS